MTKGFMKGVATVLGVAILAGAVCAAGYCSRNDDGKWFKNSDLASWHWSDKDKPQTQTWGGVIDNVGNELNTETTYAMPAAMAFYSTTAPETAASLKLSSPSVTVTCSHNFEFNNIKVDWSIEYPSGASASDVVTVTPESDGSTRATVQCSAHFDTQITLKATLRGNTEKTATCTIDYIKRIDKLNNIYICGSDFDEDSGIGCTPTFSIGTISGNLTVSTVTYRLLDLFEDEVKSYLKFDIAFSNYIAHDLILNNSFESTGENFNYSMFIKNFDNYDEAHKNAIYYAWNAAFKNGNYTKNKRSNIILDVEIELLYNGNSIQTFAETDYIGTDNLANQLCGEYYADGIAPDLTLNTNVAL